MTALLKKKTFLDFFPAPEFLLLSTTGVTLSDKSVKFIQFKRGSFSNRSKLARWDKIVLPLGAIESGYLKDTERIIAALRELSVRHGLKYVRATLPDEKAYLFTAVIDKVPEENLRDAVAFIIEENVPVTLDKAVFDYRTVAASDPKKIKVIVSVVHKKVVNAYTSVFDAAGMVVISYDIESQAIARALMPRGDETTTLIVSVGERKVSFYVVERGIVQFSATPAQDILSESTALNMRDLKAEMRKVFTFWDARVEAGNGGEKKIEKILLCGSAVNNHTLVTELVSEFPVEYNLADVWINATTPSSGSKILPESLEYVSAIGLALHRNV